MPELPEVETIRRSLQRTVCGLMIETIEVRDRRVIRGLTSEKFAAQLKGRTIRGLERCGKALAIDLDGLYLVVQPMMTGQLVAIPPGAGNSQAGDTRCTRIVFGLSKGWRLVYNDQRLFGRLQVVSDLSLVDYIRRLGPEPLEADFTADVLGQRLAGRRTPVKNLLLDSRCVAGIGNIYAAEALFRAGISPRRQAGRVKRAETVCLHRAIVDILNEAVAMGGTSVRNYRDGDGKAGRFQDLVKVYGRDGLPCTLCGRALKRIVQAQRSTVYCSACQK